MTIIEVEKIVEQLRIINLSANIAPWGIYYGNPWREKDQDYMTVRLAWDTWSFVGRARLVVKAIAWSQSSSPTNLHNMIRQLSDLITGSEFECNQIFNFSWFKVKYVEYNWSSWPYINNNRLYVDSEFFIIYARLNDW